MALYQWLGWHAAALLAADPAFGGAPAAGGADCPVGGGAPAGAPMAGSGAPGAPAALPTEAPGAAPRTVAAFRAAAIARAVLNPLGAAGAGSWLLFVRGTELKVHRHRAPPECTATAHRHSAPRTRTPPPRCATTHGAPHGRLGVPRRGAGRGATPHYVTLQCHTATHGVTSCLRHGAREARG